MTKATGIIRRIDPLGRVVIPMEIRRTLGIHENDPIEFCTNTDGGIVLTKYTPVELQDIDMIIHKTELLILMEQLHENSDLQDELLGYIRAMCKARKVLERDGGGIS